MNQTFMAMAVAKGLDGAIVNPLDGRMMATIIAAEALAGRDNFCMNDLKAFRAGMFEGAGRGVCCKKGENKFSALLKKYFHNRKNIFFFFFL
jgi:hypothetical protein